MKRYLWATAMLVALVGLAPAASAAPTGVSSCQTLGVPGAYALTADVAGVDATCMVITASNVKLDLGGHTISCTGAGFAGSCQVPAFGSFGVQVAPNVAGVVVTGPGTITGFDNGVFVAEGNALVKGVTITGPACDPGNCLRPISNGIIVLGQSGVNLLGNDVSNYARGVSLSAQCPGGDAGCVLNGNTLHDNGGPPGAGACLGILLSEATGYTLTRNLVRANGSYPCVLVLGARGGIAVSDGSTGNVITNNQSIDNLGFGISIGPGTNGNTVTNNTARGNTLADLFAFPGTSNTWNDNNRCNTEGGAVPSSVCNPGE